MGAGHSEGAATGATIRGLIWEDSDGDARRDADESGINLGVSIHLATLDGLFVAQTMPSTAGNYQFPPVAPGRYRITWGETAGFRWVVTAPARQLSGTILVPVETEEGETEMNIGLIPVSVLAGFSGQTEIFGRRVERPVVEALVNGRVCSFRSGPIFESSITRAYAVAVASDAILPGCGKPGDQVEFRVNGLVANETATWAPTRTGLLLTVGAGATPSPSKVGDGVLPPSGGAIGQYVLAIAALALVSVARASTGRRRSPSP